MKEFALILAAMSADKHQWVQPPAEKPAIVQAAPSGNRQLSDAERRLLRKAIDRLAGTPVDRVFANLQPEETTTLVAKRNVAPWQ
jgi:hypothetical protein